MEMVGDKNKTEKESRKPYGEKQEAKKIESGMGDLKRIGEELRTSAKDRKNWRMLIEN